MKLFCKCLCITFLTALLLSGGINALALEPSADFYVNDFAGVLSDATAEEIMSTATVLAQETGAQIVVLTLRGLEGQTPHDFAYALAADWGIGAGGQDSGLLIVLAPPEGQIWVEVGRGLKGALGEAEVSRLIEDYALDHYNGRDYDTGTLELYRALLSRVLVEYGREALPGYEPPNESSALPPDVGLLLVLLFLTFAFTLMGSIKRNRKSGMNRANNTSTGLSRGYRRKRTGSTGNRFHRF